MRTELTGTPAADGFRMPAWNGSTSTGRRWCSRVECSMSTVARSTAALEILERETDANGNPLTVTKIPIPGPLHMTAEENSGTDIGTSRNQTGNRLAGSYCNFYLANGAVLVPQLDPATDDEAVAILGRLFPERDTVPIPTRDLLLGGGNIHCATRQLPAALVGSPR
ncbi:MULTISPECIES: agmatine deiminase family protein [unclassified Nocardia]|uniref:agmatine deiminase family protein n=1 Tax=unclassified Nocardia TaxID=2637762 RepID=UPI001CE41427|nr:MULTISPECIES: agmatine deiminase family protein [unclassified Nocardia]